MRRKNMSKKLEAGFVMADSRNLPKIDMFMVTDFIKKSDNFNVVATRNVKPTRSIRDGYGDQAIGYVCLKRDAKICTVKCRVRPEHQVREKGYYVSLIVNEEVDEIVYIFCHDCGVANGGCDHAAAFLMWIHRRSEELSETRTECYWRKSGGTTKKCIKVNEPNEVNKKNSSTPTLSAKTGQKVIETKISPNHFLIKDREISCLSMYHLMTQFKGSGKKSPAEFLAFVKDSITTKLCLKVEKMTRGQVNSPIWLELRYGRVTASKLCELARCQAGNGSLVQQITGSPRMLKKMYRQRGKNLESEVLNVFKQNTKLDCRNAGLVLLPLWPIFGATPDAVGEDFIVEIKCPTRNDTFKNYIKGNEIQEKCKAQMQLQMLATQTKKGYLCLAGPSFKKTKEVFIIEEDFDEIYTLKLLKKATECWEEFVFPKLYEAIKY